MTGGARPRSRWVAALAVTGLAGLAAGGARVHRPPGDAGPPRIPPPALAGWGASNTLDAALHLGVSHLLGLTLLGALGGVSAVAWMRGQRRRFEALRREEGARLAAAERQAVVLDSIGDAVVATDREGRVELLNRVAEALTGWTGPEAAGRRLEDVVRIVDARSRKPVGDLPGRLSPESRAATPPVELLLIARDGRERSVEATIAPIRDEAGSFAGAVVTLCDMTERRAAEAALRESEEKFRAMFRDHTAVKLLLDPRDGRIVDANQAAARFYGWTVEELTRMRIQDINTLPPEEAGARVREAAEGRVDPYSFRHRLRDGRVRDVEAFPGRIRIGGRTYVHAVIHDVTEQKEAEENAKLSRRHEAESLARMAGGIAHRYNNLLQVVSSGIDLALDDVRRGDDPSHALGAALGAAERAADLGGMMLAYLGQTSARRHPLDLSDVCRPLVEAVRAEVPRGVAFQSELPDPGPAVKGNADEIRQVARILLVNAREAMADFPGTLSLRVSIARPEDVPAHGLHPADFALPTGGLACLEVTDEGGGIPGGALDELFVPFFSTKFTGRGLGLPVALGIVRAHGGCIAVESDADSGTTFRVYLPLSTESAAQASTVAAPEEGEASRRGKVLVVDDDPMVLQTSARMLERLGMVPLAASDGEEAVEILRAHGGAVSCVVCDLTMPGMDGWEALARMRELVPGIPVVLMSGHGTGEVLEGARSELPQAVLGKPFRLQDLREALTRALRGTLPPGDG